MPNTDKRQATIFGEMQRAAVRPTSGKDFLFDLFQEAVESASGGAGLGGYIPLSEGTEAIDRNAGALAIAAAIAYAGKEVADAIREAGAQFSEHVADAFTPADD